MPEDRRRFTSQFMAEAVQMVIGLASFAGPTKRRTFYQRMIAEDSHKGCWSQNSTTRFLSGLSDRALTGCSADQDCCCRDTGNCPAGTRPR